MRALYESKTQQGRFRFNRSISGLVVIVFSAALSAVIDVPNQRREGAEIPASIDSAVKLGRFQRPTRHLFLSPRNISYIDFINFNELDPIAYRKRFQLLGEQIV